MNKKLILDVAIVFIVVVVIVLLFVITFLLAQQEQVKLAEQRTKIIEQTERTNQDFRHIVTFEQCANAGGVILDLDPRSCTTEDGVTFTDWQGAGKFCIQVITPAKNPQTGEVRNFPTPCDVPRGWI